MKAATSALAVVPACVLGLLVIPAPPAAIRAADPPAAALMTGETDSAIAAVVEANGGKPPRTGEELWKALTKLGKFAQLPVVFSAVRLASGIASPRIIIAPVINGLSDADVTKPNLDGRLYLAANMERGDNGSDPRVTSVEFISWNTQRRRYDFGMIENMGGESESELRIVDGGKCFTCHKNRGPILGITPWSNTTHHRLNRALVINQFQLASVQPAGGVDSSRVDGMALASPEAELVDRSTRLGTLLQLNRETFRLMNKWSEGRKRFVAMLLVILEPVSLDSDNRSAKLVVDQWAADSSYDRFAKEWMTLAKSTNSGLLADFVPTRIYDWNRPPKPLPTPPPGGFTSPKQAREFESRLKLAKSGQQFAELQAAKNMEIIAKYDRARSSGTIGMPASAQPSNPRAFIRPSFSVSHKPSTMVNPLMLAGTIGLTEGDRFFLTGALNDAVQRVNKPKATAAVLARAVFEGPEFADVLAGGELPDRDEFKDRFVVGLDQHLRTQYPFTQGLPVKRADYASGPAYNPKAGEERELAVVPSTACLRCHEVRGSAKRAPFDVIPPLAFDPLDKTAREAWVKTAGEQRRLEVLSRLTERIHEDKDMPPEDSPEHDLFRVKQAAAFEELKQFLTSELSRAKKR
jgi:hypothetical protein